MADRYVEKTHQGYFSRIGNSIMGVLIGFLMLPGSVLLISWNEYRTIHRTKGLIEAEKVVEEVADPLEILPSHENKLVHVVGKATTEEELVDTEFSLKRVALRLAREVEMYQWVEHKESKTRDKVGGGRETITTYTYNKRWESDRVESNSFHEKNGHENPPLRYHSNQLTTTKATLGSYRMSPSQIESINQWQPLKISEDQLQALGSEAAKFRLQGDQLYWSESAVDPEHPKLGDLRIAFKAVDPLTISLLARQSGESLTQFKTSNGESIEYVEAGEHTSADMFESLRRQNSILAWILRGVGWLLACLGFGLIMGPISALASVLPFLGRLTGMATFVVALLLGSCLALVAIGVAWIVVRPALAIALFAVAGIGMYLLFRRKPKPKEPPIAVLA